MPKILLYLGDCFPQEMLPPKQYLGNYSDLFHFLDLGATTN